MSKFRYTLLEKFLDGVLKTSEYPLQPHIQWPQKKKKIGFHSKWKE